MKESETILEKTQFEVEMSIIKTKDEEEVRTRVFNSNEGQSTITLDYQFACDKVRKKIVPPWRYDHVDLICYTLMWMKGRKTRN